ncbi:MAG: hypothetical protein GVY06_03760 [Alphaproteobacteria bacterium]|jgi:ribosomal protein S17E|nr:hypothetical protein [Alphaproteobacteria bacterium]
MSEPEYQTLEVLKRIQSELTAIRSEVGDNKRLLEEAVEEREALAGYITHAVGLSSETRVDIDMIRKEIKEMQARIRALEDAQ